MSVLVNVSVSVSMYAALSVCLFIAVGRYNPILGEFFTCSYRYKDGSHGYYISEQGTSSCCLIPLHTATATRATVST